MNKNKALQFKLAAKANLAAAFVKNHVQVSIPAIKNEKCITHLIQYLDADLPVDNSPCISLSETGRKKLPPSSSL